jgi:hypothetical protein
MRQLAGANFITIFYSSYLYLMVFFLYLGKRKLGKPDVRYGFLR